VRTNLDPFGVYEEGDLWRALGAVGLQAPIAALHSGLEAAVVDGGNNFSQV
jgi:ABC-type multidrug transport system fused ATPase/permease subunit